MVVESPEEADPAFFDVVIEEEVEEVLPFLEFIRPEEIKTSLEPIEMFEEVKSPSVDVIIEEEVEEILHF